MWVVKRSVLLTPVAITKAKAASERRALKYTRIRRQQKYSSLIGRTRRWWSSKQKPLLRLGEGELANGQHQRAG